jgi:acyl-CoA synthetase (NDP forming)
MSAEHVSSPAAVSTAATSAMSAIEAIMRPRSVAVIGASSARQALGNQVLQNLRKEAFAGDVLCVSPRASSIEGWPAVPSVAALPGDLDVAVVSVPASAVTGVLRELDEQGCRAAVVPAAGFTGAELAELDAAARSLRIRFNGPNCLGVFSVAASAPLWTAGYGNIRRGNVSIISQSGSASISIMTSPGLGFARIASSGNETSVTSADYLSWLAQDEATDVIGLEIEGISDARAFEAAVGRVQAAGKSVVALKVGRTPVGSRAAQAHTGGLITGYDAYQAYFARLGVPAVLNYDDMIATLQVLASRPRRPCRGTSVGIFAISGGQSALASDLATENRLQLAEFSAETSARLRAALPDFDGTNPVDLGATVGHDRRNPDEALRAIIDDPSVDSVLVIQDAHERLALDPGHWYLENVRGVVDIGREAAKPVVLASSASAGIHPLLQELVDDSPVPFLRGLDKAVIALRGLGTRRPEEPPYPLAAPPAELAELREELRRQSGPVGYGLTRRLLAAYDLPAAPSVLARDASDAEDKAAALGYPVVAKIASPDIPHRSDIGAVVVNIASATHLHAAIRDITEAVSRAAPGARIEGFEIQPYVPGGVEVILGFTSEPALGAMVVVGSGGVLAEVTRDRAADLAPISPARARALIAATGLGAILAGYRRAVEPTDAGQLAQTVHKVAAMAADLHDVVAAADFNPAFVRSGSGDVQIVDALFIAAGS